MEAINNSSTAELPTSTFGSYPITAGYVVQPQNQKERLILELFKADKITLEEAAVLLRGW